MLPFDRKTDTVKHLFFYRLMASELTRRGALGGMALGMTSMAGCLQTLLTGCEDQSRYILILTELERDAVRTDPIGYQNLSSNERRLVEKTLDNGRYEMCPQDVSDNESRALYDFADRVQDHRSNGYAYLQYEGRYYQIGLVLSAVYYARTEHHPNETSVPTQDG